MENGTINFTGTLAPGDVLVVDNSTKQVLKNGINVLDQASLKFFEIEQSYDGVQYKDSEGSRSVHINITYSPKYK